MLSHRSGKCGEAALPVAARGGERAYCLAVNDALEGALVGTKAKGQSHEGLGAVGYFVGTKEAAGSRGRGLLPGTRIESDRRSRPMVANPKASDSERRPRGMGWNSPRRSFGSYDDDHTRCSSL